jgi:hypothetical protein
MDGGFVLRHVLAPSLRCCTWLSFNRAPSLPAEDGKLGRMADHLPPLMRQAAGGQDEKPSFLYARALHSTTPSFSVFHRLRVRCISNSARRSNQRRA